MAEILKVVIIGAGRIGCGFDAPDAPQILTHAHAIKNDPRFTLVGLLDTDQVRGKNEAVKWGTEYYSDIDIVFEKGAPDIVVVATPDATHADMLERVAYHKPRLIICEKPVVTSAQEEARVQEIDIPVVVNFSRRFDATVQDIRARLHAGEYGRVLSGSGIYTKGTLHNGSHMIDLARYLFGEMKTAAASVRVDDFPEGEASYGGVASFDLCDRFFLIPADARAYAIFEFDILTEKKRIRFVDEGQNLIIQNVTDDPLYVGFRILGDTQVQKTGLLHVLEGLYDHVAKVLDGGEEIRSSLDSALKTNAACLSIVESFKKR